MNSFYKLAIILLAISLSGCHGFQTLSVNDVRKEKYFYKKVTFEKSLEEVQSALYTYTSNCNPVVPFNVDPSNPKKAQMIFKTMGLTDYSIICVLDFKEITQDSTNLETYSYYSTWHGKIDDVINAIESPKSCE